MSPVELIKVAKQCTGGMTTIPCSLGMAVPQDGASQLMSSFSLKQVAQHWRHVPWHSGLAATLLRDGIPHGAWFLSYDMCKEYMRRSTHASVVAHRNNSIVTDDGLPVYIPLASGAVAATVAWGVGYPADLIKTRIQCAAAIPLMNRDQCTSKEPAGIVSTARTLIAEANGNIIRGLYRGFSMKLVRSIPASMIGFTVYESVKEKMTEHSLFLRRNFVSNNVS